MPRRVVALTAALGAAALAGCTGASTGDDPAAVAGPSSTAPATPSPSTTSPSAAATGSASTTATGQTTSGGATPSVTASVAQPAAPVVTAGNAGAWTLTRAAPGAPESRQVAVVQCGQDGSVTADGLRLTAGAASLTLADPAVTVTGTATLDAAGGTFRGRDADTAVAFTWTC